MPADTSGHWQAVSAPGPGEVRACGAGTVGVGMGRCWLCALPQQHCGGGGSRGYGVPRPWGCWCPVQGALPVSNSFNE